MTNFKQLDIPHTTPRRYITGIYALNVPDDEEVADWHTGIFWRPVGIDGRQTEVTLGGEGSKHNTNPIYRQYGVRDAKDQLIRIGLSLPEDAKKVYVADHARAILDMLFFQLKESGEAAQLTNAAEWLRKPRAKDLLAKAALLDAFLNDSQKEGLARWIDHERESIV
ncbi:hypothetical protein EOM60_01120 [Candidatus Saccharibacteria bacterium]|nr:hypothetical protein [Candidatus Saccharibacteria bacterium]